MPEVATKLTTYRFEQMAALINDRVDKPAASGVEKYVGLEHLDADSLRIRRWGDITDVESTKLRFQPGDIIFGKRRVYQRKLAVADFEGICSAHAMVLRAKPEIVLPEFLPFFMQSDHFMERALEISVGSLSPTINWKTLAAEEFALPPLEEQRRIVGILHATAATVESLVHARACAEGLFQSKVDHAFVRSAERNGNGVVPLADLSQKVVDGVHKRPDYVDDGVPFLTVENLTRGPGIDFSDTRFVSQDDHEQFFKRANPELGDVLISKDGTLGVPRVVEVDVPFSIFVSVALVKPKRDVLDPWFLRFYFESTLFKRHIASRFSGSALKHIHLVDLRESPVPCLALAEQQNTARVLSEVHAGLLALHERVVQARRVMQQVLGAVVGEVA